MPASRTSRTERQQSADATHDDAAIGEMLHSVQCLQRVLRGTARLSFGTGGNAQSRRHAVRDEHTTTSLHRLVIIDRHLRWVADHNNVDLEGVFNIGANAPPLNNTPASVAAGLPVIIDIDDDPVVAPVPAPVVAPVPAPVIAPVPAPVVVPARAPARRPRTTQVSATIELVSVDDVVDIVERALLRERRVNQPAAPPPNDLIQRIYSQIAHNPRVGFAATRHSSTLPEVAEALDRIESRLDNPVAAPVAVPAPAAAATDFERQFAPIDAAIRRMDLSLSTIGQRSHADATLIGRLEVAQNKIGRMEQQCTHAYDLLQAASNDAEHWRTRALAAEDRLRRLPTNQPPPRA